MISISDEALDILGLRVAVANTAGFLWRNLSSSPTVENLARQHSPAEIEERLTELLEQDSLLEGDLTSAYCVLVALLLQGQYGVERAEQVTNIDRLPLARSMIVGQASNSQTTSVAARQNPRLVLPRGTRAWSSATRLIVSNSPRLRPPRKQPPIASATIEQLLTDNGERQ